MEKSADKVINSVMRELEAESYSVGGLLHGSFAVGTQHPESDVDILCVTSTDWLSKEIREVDGMEVEIQKIPEEKVRKDLTLRLPTNNNFMLNIFCEGRILFDKSGRMKLLKQQALEAWRGGPPEPSPFEICMGRSFFRHRLDEARRLAQGEDPLGLAKVMMSLLFLNAVYGYCKTHQKWATKLRHLMGTLREEDPEFHKLCSSFLAATSVEEGLKWIEQVVDAVMEPVGWGTPFYKTPQVPLSRSGQMRDGMFF